MKAIPWRYWRCFCSGGRCRERGLRSFRCPCCPWLRFNFLFGHSFRPDGSFCVDGYVLRFPGCYRLSSAVVAASSWLLLLIFSTKLALWLLKDTFSLEPAPGFPLTSTFCFVWHLVKRRLFFLPGYGAACCGFLFNYMSYLGMSPPVPVFIIWRMISLRLALSV